MASTGGSGRARRTGAAIAATLAAPFLLYLIVWAIPAPLPPADPLLATRIEMYKSIVPNHRVGERQVALARAAALRAPLAYEPFFVQARAAEQSGDLRRAIRLMEEVRRRRSNFVPSRLQLAAYYGMTDRFRPMFDEIDVALGLNDEVRQAVVAELSRLIAIPDGRNELAAALARNPSWRRDFFAAAHGRPFEPADTLALYQAVLSHDPPFTPALEYRLYLESLVRVGQVARARALWLRTMPPDRRERHALLFDGDFAGAHAMPPFGWEFAQSEAGRAEPMGGQPPYLQVDYFGGRNEVLAEQIVALPPGRYRISYAARSEEGVSDAHIRWVFACYPSGAELAAADITNLGGSFRRRSFGVEVPSAACNGQVLRLIGSPGDVSVPVFFQVTSVRIAR